MNVLIVKLRYLNIVVVINHISKSNR